MQEQQPLQGRCVIPHGKGRFRPDVDSIRRENP
jgi:hypothetical protein